MEAPKYVVQPCEGRRRGMSGQRYARNAPSAHAPQAKSMARQQRFYELTERARDMPTPDAKVDFGNAAGAMARQGGQRACGACGAGKGRVG